jgi:energy-coupling factor transporter ATP-binding protein EcfA2
MSSNSSDTTKDLPKDLTREEALRLPVPRKLAYFSAVRLMHARIREVLSDLEIRATPGSGTDITLLIGPTGVGKSTLTDGLRGKILRERHLDLLDDPGYIPVVMVEAPASGERIFSWRIFYQRLGDALFEPQMDRKQETATQNGRTVVRPAGSFNTVASMRRAVEQALKGRRTFLVIIDEAVHLLRNLHGDTLANHMDALKSLSNICGVTLTLVGSYDLYQILELSGQVARRSALVHFERYLPGVEEDEKAFRHVLQNLQGYLPLENPPNLMPFASHLHENAMGCVGILKDILSRALAMSLAKGGIWSDDYLERSLLSQSQMVSILEEILIGEAQVRGRTAGGSTFNSMGLAAKEVAIKISGAA